jgi:flavodoxin
VSSPRAAVVYRSHTGNTRRYGEEIAAHLRTLGVDAVASSIADCDPAGLAGVDLVLLGCWTNGWFVVHQHPDTPWASFARDLPPLAGSTVGLFTTYTLVTGSMFARMRAAIAHATPDVRAELKSRGGHLSDADRRALAALVEGLPAH